jgi:hypothetical protein
MPAVQLKVLGARCNLTLQRVPCGVPTRLVSPHMDC